MDGASSSINRGYEYCVQGFSGDSWGQETTWKTNMCME